MLFNSRRDLTDGERAQFDALAHHQTQARAHRAAKANVEWHGQKLVQAEDTERVTSASREEAKKALHEALANA